jgi:hypothetical protein
MRPTLFRLRGLIPALLRTLLPLTFRPVIGNADLSYFDIHTLVSRTFSSAGVADVTSTRRRVIRVSTFRYSQNHVRDKCSLLCAPWITRDGSSLRSNVTSSVFILAAS